MFKFPCLLIYLCLIIIVTITLCSSQNVKNNYFKNIKSKENVRVRKQNENKSSSSSLICVVGAGLSGLHISDLLERKGHRVYLFEQRPNVGGKILTYRHGNIVQVEMSPLFFRNTDNSLLDKIQEFDLTSLPFNETDILGFDPKTGTVNPLPRLNEDERGQLMDAMDRFIDLRSKYSTQLDHDLAYASATSDLCISTDEWLKSKGLEALRPLFKRFVTMQGYGDLEDIPALYALKFINPEQVMSTGGMYMTLEEGLDVLAHNMADKLDHIFLHHQVVRIARGSDGIDLTSLNLDGPFYATVKCGKVILAFPPLLPNLERIVVDLNKEEMDVLDHVKINRVTTGAHYIPSLKHFNYVANDGSKGQGQGQVIRLVRQTARGLKNIYSSYSWIRGDFRSILSAKEDTNIERQLITTLTKLNKDYLYKGPSTTFFRETSEFFPHVNSASLQQGFYEMFDNIQGRKGLYYATTLLGFESMDSALKISRALVDKYF